VEGSGCVIISGIPCISPVRLLETADGLSEGRLFWCRDLNPAPFEQEVIAVISSLVVIRAIKSRRMGWTGRVAHIGESREMHTKNNIRKTDSG
jgi:hypothetical protein